MQDIDSLKTRLAREEEELVVARTEIDTAHRRIEELRKHADSLEKRIKLLREYVELVESGGSDPGLATLLDGPGDAAANSSGSSAASKSFADQLVAASPAEEEEPELDIPDMSTVPSPAPAPAKTKEIPVSFDHDIDERQLGDEILPRAESFEEALLFMMAHHRKRITPSGIIKVFRQLEYSPEIQATKEAIIAYMEQRPAFFAHAGKEGFVLTAQGREEAERLLSQLTL